MPSESRPQPVDTGLEMDLVLAGRACLAQLPALAARRLRAHQGDIDQLQALSAQSPSAQRLSRKLFGLLANASIHCGGADTLRPLFEHCSLVRAYLWLSARVAVSAPEPLARGTPDLVVDAGDEEIWVDTRARAADVLAGRGRQAVLLVDRTMSMRREPPLRLGAGYAGEFHLLAAHAQGAATGTGFALEQQCVPGRADDPRWLRALSAVPCAAADREHSA